MQVKYEMLRSVQKEGRAVVEALRASLAPRVVDLPDPLPYEGSSQCSDAPVWLSNVQRHEITALLAVWFSRLALLRTHRGSDLAHGDGHRSSSEGQDRAWHTCMCANPRLCQVFENTESARPQYALRERAVALGWPLDRIIVIDSDLEQSGATAADREGFQRLVTEVSLGRVGIVLGIEVSRLARNSSDWHRLLELCAFADTLILDEDGLYDPAHFNDRLLLGRGRRRRGNSPEVLPDGPGTIRHLQHIPTGRSAMLGSIATDFARFAAFHKRPTRTGLHGFSSVFIFAMRCTRDWRT